MDYLNTNDLIFHIPRSGKIKKIDLINDIINRRGVIDPVFVNEQIDIALAKGTLSYIDGFIKIGKKVKLEYN